MSSIHPPRGKARETARYLIAVRTGKRGSERIVISPSLQCSTCGNNAMAMGDFAEIAGVTPRDVSNFLNRRPVRDDVAKRIRLSVLEVDE